MSELVKQLRSEAANWAGDLLDDAADRIEALEAALREIAAVEVVDPWSACGTMQIKARAALAPPAQPLTTDTIDLTNPLPGDPPKAGDA